MVDSIHDLDIDRLKKLTIAIGKKVREYSETDSKYVELYSKLFDLYRTVLMRAKGYFGESINQVIEVVTEWRDFLNIGFIPESLEIDDFMDGI